MRFLVCADEQGFAVNDSKKTRGPFFQIPRRARRVLTFMSILLLLLGVSTLITGEFSTSRTNTRATGTTAIVIGVVFTSAGLAFLAALLVAKDSKE